MNRLNNNQKGFFTVNKIFLILSLLMVIVACSPVEPENAITLRLMERVTVTGVSSGIFPQVGRSTDSKISVAISGNYAVVTAYGDDANNEGSNGNGSAYIFAFNGSNWIQQTKIFDRNAQPAVFGDLFGDTVDIDGDYIIVGATSDDESANNGGAAYIFARDGSNWTQQAKLTADDASAGNYFGESVAIDGDYAIVGSTRNNGSVIPYAYVYVRNGNNWSQQAKLTSSNWTTSGASVAIDGNTAMVNGYNSVYVFTRSGSTWTQQATLEVFNSPGQATFDDGIALDGDTAIFGDPGEFVDGHVSRGAAYIYTRNGENWSQQAKLIADDGAAGDLFGWSVSIDGDIAIVGAFREGDDKSREHTGAIYIFNRSGNNWKQQKFIAGDGASTSFGYSVSLEADRAIVGGLFITNNHNTGSAYIYQLQR